jgi:hypothetical protein
MRPIVEPLWNNRVLHRQSRHASLRVAVTAEVGSREPDSSVIYDLNSRCEAGMRQVAKLLFGTAPEQGQTDAMICFSENSQKPVTPRIGGGGSGSRCIALLSGRTMKAERATAIPPQNLGGCRDVYSKRSSYRELWFREASLAVAQCSRNRYCTRSLLLIATAARSALTLSDDSTVYGRRLSPGA